VVQCNVSNVTYRHCGLDVAYVRPSDWNCLQWALHSLIFGVQHSDFLEVGTKIDIHNNGMLDKGKTEHFYLNIGRIIGNFHFSIVPQELWELISPTRERANFFFLGGGIGQLAQCNV